MSVLRCDEGRSGATRILQIEVGLLQNLDEIIAGPDGRAAIVDPAFEVDRLLREAAAHDFRIEAVLVTHTHHDHIDGLWDTVRLTGARVYVGRGELDKVRETVASAVPDPTIIPLDGGETLSLGELSIQTLATPGHTIAGISYLFDGCVCTGDTLFIGGCGRTDFPGGDPKVLWASLQKLAELPEETRVYPGHDYGATPTSTIGHELATNPYLRCADEAAFVALRTGKSPPRPTRGPR
jgi:glyoxylase-like metal-dependent hydrolase (beta-lactamase superfamily II)